MQIGDLTTSVAAPSGNSIREKLEFSKPIYNETPLLHFFTWALNSSVDFSLKENNNVDPTNIEFTTSYFNSSTPKYPETHSEDSLSIMWYLASFGTLVMFFLLISFSEVCCKKSMAMSQENESEVSPPPYDLFAPPTYDSLYKGKKEKNCNEKKKKKCEIFVINVFGNKTKSKIPSSQTRDIPRREYR